MTGRFITLEGGEGAGKSTQLAVLHAALAATGIEVVATREPGGTPGAEAIRALIIDGATDRWDSVTETLLVNAARADHAARLIRPALARGAWVICDRFIDSTLAYQGVGKGVPRPVLIEQHRFATGSLWPDLTLVLDVPVALGIARADARHAGATRFEALDAGFHRRVAASFLAAAADDPQRVRVIDGSLPIDAVAVAIWAQVEPLLDRRC